MLLLQAVCNMANAPACEVDRAKLPSVVSQLISWDEVVEPPVEHRPATLPPVDCKVCREIGRVNAFIRLMEF
jgi:hypothetical protein